MVLIGGWGAYFEGAGVGGGGFRLLSDVFFFQVGGSITAGLISGRGAYIGGGGGRLIIVCTFFQVGGPITLGLISGSLW